MLITRIIKLGRDFLGRLDSNLTKGEKADPVYPGYGHNPGDPEDTVAIHRIRRIRPRYTGYRGYYYNP